MVDTNYVSHSRKRKGVKDKSPTNSDKIRAGKCKKYFAGHPRNCPPSYKHDFFVTLDTPWRSVKYSRNMLRSILRRNQTSKPARVKNTTVEILTSLNKTLRR